MVREFYKSGFQKNALKGGGIYAEYFWDMAKKSGLWECETYSSPMSEALEKLTKVEIVNDENGNYIYSVFKLT